VAIALLLLFLPLRGGWIPTDVDAMNRFAQEYNSYARELQAGRIDVKQWVRVEQAYKALR
jgi:hypothetical protein